MREVRNRSFYCPKVDETVTITEFTRCAPGCEPVCGILSCSHQDFCAKENARDGRPVHPWCRCPACKKPGEEEAE